MKTFYICKLINQLQSTAFEIVGQYQSTSDRTQLPEMAHRVATIQDTITRLKARLQS